MMVEFGFSIDHHPRFVMPLPTHVANEIARLMRDPDALRHESEGMPSSGRSGHYDPNQPRVPAGQSGGGQWADTGRNADARPSTELAAQAQKQPELSIRELARICALDPAKVAADLANTLLEGVGRVDPLTGQVRTLDWVRQEAYKMEQTIRSIQQQLCRPA
jgi:hypothetical protein